MQLSEYIESLKKFPQDIEVVKHDEEYNFYDLVTGVEATVISCVPLHDRLREVRKGSLKNGKPAIEYLAI